ncbi:uncharacterized protein LOC111089305, partial [Limulus polyphemus]|uniref:Uncharacterized protein LOC111089305 n=1 Tax=Limulus polyphemus TaxID=6850 RepID=A0ABM1TN07_LIMPO
EDTLGGSFGEVSVEEALAEIQKVDLSEPLNFLSKKILSVWKDNDSSVHENIFDNSFPEEGFHHSSQDTRYQTTTSPHQMSASFSLDALVSESEQSTPRNTPKLLPSQMSAAVSLDAVISESEQYHSTPKNFSGLSPRTNKRQFISPERSQTQMEEDDLIPPSQDFRETVGETVKTSFPSLRKTKISKKSSTAGF